MDVPDQKQCTVSGALGVVLRISKILGLAPLKFKRVRDGWRVCVSPATDIYGKINVFLICIITMTSLILEFHKEPHLSTLFKTSSDVVACLSSVTFVLSSLIVASYFGIHRMQCVITSLAQLQKVTIVFISLFKLSCLLNYLFPSTAVAPLTKDIFPRPAAAGTSALLVILTLYCYVKSEVSQYGPLSSYKTAAVLFFSVFSFVELCLILCTQYSVTLYNLILKENNLLAHLLYLIYYIAIMMNKLLILQVILVLLTIPVPLYQLNDCLKRLLGPIRNQYTTYKSPEISGTVKHLRTLYCSLCGVIKRIDESYGVILVILIPHFLVCLVISLYNLITGLFKGETALYAAVTQVTWLTIHTINMIMIIEPCHLTYEQMDRTKRLIGQLLLFTPPENHDVIHELELFYKQLMNDVIYTPMGILYLNRSVIITIIGSITTYLVVMVDL